MCTTLRYKYSNLRKLKNNNFAPNCQLCPENTSNCILNCTNYNCNFIE